MSSPLPPSPLGDRLAAARAGSRDALGELLEAYRRYLLRVAREMVDPDLAAKAGASDLVQEAFHDAYRDFEQFRGTSETEFMAWLRQVLVHQVYRFAEYYRDTQKRAAGREQAVDAAADLADRGTTPSGHLMAGERSSAVQDAIARLPADYQKVVLLRHRDELTFEEIGEVMGRSADAARKLWLRAVERLNEELSEGRNE